MQCMNCGGTNDVIDFKRGEETLILCADCRFRLLAGPKNKVMGRPTLGVTRKVSVTLPESVWAYVEREAGGNKSEYIRKLIERDMWNRQEWSNNACLGYAIYGAEELGYSEKETEKLVRAIYRAFDFKTIDEAKKKYENSPY